MDTNANVICQVKVAGVACERPIGQGEGVPVGSEGRLWIVCRPCAARGVRIHDVDHAPPIFGGDS